MPLGFLLYNINEVIDISKILSQQIDLDSSSQLKQGESEAQVRSSSVSVRRRDEEQRETSCSSAEGVENEVKN